MRIVDGAYSSSSLKSSSLLIELLLPRMASGELLAELHLKNLNNLFCILDQGCPVRVLYDA